MTGHRSALLSCAPIALGGVLSAASLQAPGVRPVAGQGEEFEVLTGEKIEPAAIVMTDSFGDAFFTIDYNQSPMSSGNGTIVDGMEFTSTGSATRARAPTSTSPMACAACFVPRSPWTEAMNRVGS